MTYMKLSAVHIWLFKNLGFRFFPDFIVNLEWSDNLGFEVVSTDQIKQAIGAEEFRQMECDVVSYSNVERKHVSSTDLLTFIEQLNNDSFEGWDSTAITGYKTALETIKYKIKEYERK